MGQSKRGITGEYASATAGAGGPILAVRVGRIGDVVMITPALRMMLEGFPSAEVHLLGTAEAARVLRGFDPRLARVHRYHRRFPESLVLPGRMRRELQSAGYSRALVFESNTHYRKLVEGVAPCVKGFAEAKPEAHFAARCMAVVEAAIAAEGRPAPERCWLNLPVTADGRAAAAKHLAQHGLSEADVLVGLHCTYHETGRWFSRDRRGLNLISARCRRGTRARPSIRRGGIARRGSSAHARRALTRVRRPGTLLRLQVLPIQGARGRPHTPP